MKNVFLCRLSVAFFATFLTACSGGGYQDLDAFMAEKKAVRSAPIKPIPVFQSYKAFVYSATAMRSPFEQPIDVTEITLLRMATNVKPDLNRSKEYLEQFSLDSFSMVGSLEQSGVFWALLEGESGGVHRTKLDHYVGRNHGRIVEATESYISIIEIVPNGVDGWIERPRTIKLKTIEEER